jgi:hypothetical protein
MGRQEQRIVPLDLSGKKTERIAFAFGSACLQKQPTQPGRSREKGRRLSPFSGQALAWLETAAERCRLIASLDSPRAKDLHGQETR